jgi:hypothetical protein
MGQEANRACANGCRGLIPYSTRTADPDRGCRGELASDRQMSPPFIGGAIMIGTAYVISDSFVELAHRLQCKMIRWMGRVEPSDATDLSDQEK